MKSVFTGPQRKKLSQKALKAAVVPILEDKVEEPNVLTNLTETQ